MLLFCHGTTLKRRIIGGCCAWLLLFASPTPAGNTDPLNIFVSVLPQKYIVERIGGEQTRVSAMVQPGYSPATYEPNPRQISKLAKADLYIRVGVPFENSWMERIRAVNPDMPVLDARDNMQLRTLEVHHHDDSNEHQFIQHQAQQAIKQLPAQDPHIWTSPRQVQKMAVQIAEQLSQLQPEYREQFADNLSRFNTELEQLDKELTALFSDTRQRKFMVFHPSWGYFADAYGLTQVPIEVDGKEPGAQTLATLIKQAREEKIKTIFIQPQFDDRIARQVAAAVGGKVVTIDPLAEDYLDNIRQAAQQLAGVIIEQSGE